MSYSTCKNAGKATTFSRQSSRRPAKDLGSSSPVKVYIYIYNMVKIISDMSQAATNQPTNSTTATSLHCTLNLCRRAVAFLNQGETTTKQPSRSSSPVAMHDFAGDICKKKGLKNFCTHRKGDGCSNAKVSTQNFL